MKMRSVANTKNPNEDIRILRAGHSHVSEIKRLQNELFVEKWSQESIAALLRQPCACAFVASIIERQGQDKILAYLLSMLCDQSSEIFSIGVDAELQKRGLGKRLVHELMETSRNEGACEIFLEVACNNAPAIALYKSIGFQVKGQRKRYYQSNGAGIRVDALVLKFCL